MYGVIYNITNYYFPCDDASILFGFSVETIPENISRIKINVANHILLIAKMCVSKHRYGNSNNSNYISIIFESEFQMRKKYLEMS